MNKNKKPLDSQNRKKQAKEVKKAQKLLVTEEPPRTDTLIGAKSVKKYPPKSQKAINPLVKAVAKAMEIKKKKKQAKHSKRTNTAKVDFHESVPAHLHPEGQRWGKTVVKQSVGKGKALTAKIRKRASGTPKGKK